MVLLSTGLLSMVLLSTGLLSMVLIELNKYDDCCRTSCKGNDTKGAHVVASAHDGNECACGVRLPDRIDVWRCTTIKRMRRQIYINLYIYNDKDIARSTH
jgi:hypothetical protein